MGYATNIKRKRRIDRTLIKAWQAYRKECLMMPVYPVFPLTGKIVEIKP